MKSDGLMNGISNDIKSTQGAAKSSGPYYKPQ